MAKRTSWRNMLKRLRWDLLDRRERFNYGYWLIWQIPGIFGNLLRARYVARRIKGAGENLKVMAGCRFRSPENLEVGRNVSIGFDNFIQALGGIRIGDNVSTAPGVKIWSVNHEYGDADTAVQQQGLETKPVRIGNDVFIGSNAFVLPGADLAEGCVVSAGAVVGGKAYRPFSILAGNPARVIGYRGGRHPGGEEDASLPQASARE